MAEDDRKDEGRLPAARSSIYVRAIGQYCGDSLFVAALNGVGQWKGITHRTVPFETLQKQPEGARALFYRKTALKQRWDAQPKTAVEQKPS